MKFEVIIFALVGLISVAIDFALYLLLLSFGTGVSWAKGISFTAGAVFSYHSNKKWTFNAWGSPQVFIAFCALYLITFIINVAVNNLVLGFFGLGEMSVLISFITATGCSAIINYYGMKFRVFKATKDIMKPFT